jgi:GntR family transcriptional regulator
VIEFRLNTRIGVPPYLQIVQQVKHALRLGMLDVGDQLPPVKAVVGQLTINANTVLKAYRDLEREGLVESRSGIGTFILRRPPGPSPQTQMKLQRGLDRWLHEAQAAGLDLESIEALIRATIYSAMNEGVA